MLSRLSAFADMPTPVKIGLLVVSGGGIAGLVYYLPMTARIILIIGIAVVSVMVLLYSRILKKARKRKSAPMERGILENTTTSPQGISDPAQVARLDDLRKKFESGIEKYKAAGKNFYDFPWYLVVGEPGSGKTEAIRHCNVGFPPGLQDQFQGAGGTVNMNWWFTDHAVILDTAGRLMFEQIDTGGSAEWKEFLKLLKKYRLNCPINGMFLVIPADSLIKDTADEIEQKASKIARQLDVIQRTLDVRFPVFVIISKSDLIHGFRDFFDNLNDPELQHQILGWSNPNPIDEPYTSDFISLHLEKIRSRLFRRRLALLQKNVTEDYNEDVHRVDSLYAFPESIKKLAPRMARYLELIFSVGSQWSCKPLFFRGIYFTSSMQEGSALDMDLAESLGIPVESLPEGRIWTQDRAYFLRDLFIKKVFKEKGLVTRASNAKKMYTRRRRIVLLSSVVSILLLLIFTIYTFGKWKTSVGTMNEYLRYAANLNKTPEEIEQDTPKYRIKPEHMWIIDFTGDEPIYYPDGDIITNSNLLGNIKVKDFYAEGIKIADEWKQEVPLIFKLAAKMVPNAVSPSDMDKTLSRLYELGVAIPFIDNVSWRINKDYDYFETNKVFKDEWDIRKDRNEAILCLHQLISIKAGNPVIKVQNNDSADSGAYSKYTDSEFLDPFMKYLHSDKIQGYMQKTNSTDKSQKDVLHYPLEILYGTNNDVQEGVAWPSDTLKNSIKIETIKKGIGLFNSYWKNDNNKDQAQVTGIKSIVKKLEEFKSIEDELLKIPGKFDTASEENSKKILLQQWQTYVQDMNDVCEALKDMDIKDELLDSAWGDSVGAISNGLDMNYKFLTEPLNMVKDSENPISGIKAILVSAHEECKSSLTDPNFTQPLSDYDNVFYSYSEDKSTRSYLVRHEMYKMAGDVYKNLDTDADISSLSEILSGFNENKKNAKNGIFRKNELLKVGQKKDTASAASTAILDVMTSYGVKKIIANCLAGIPGTLKEIEEEVKTEYWSISKENETKPNIVIDKITLEYKPEYDPDTAAKVFKGFESLSDELSNEEYAFSKKREEIEGPFKEYLGEYISYWFEIFPEEMITEKFKMDWMDQFAEEKNITTATWKQQSGFLQNKYKYKSSIPIFLGEYGRVISNKVVNPMNTYIVKDPVFLKFKKNLDDLKNVIFENNCNKLVRSWKDLPPDSIKARLELSKEERMELDYTPTYYDPLFIEGQPGQFINRYYRRLVCDSLVVLANDFTRKCTEAYEKNIQSKIDRFPLSLQSDKDLTREELAGFINSLNIISPVQYKLSMPDPDDQTYFYWQEINVQIDRLVSFTPGDIKMKQQLQRISRLQEILPSGPDNDPYYCKISMNEIQKSSFVNEFTIAHILQANEISHGECYNPNWFISVKYPIEHPIKILLFRSVGDHDEFRKYESQTQAFTLEIPGPWACLKMIHGYSNSDTGINCLYDKGKNAITVTGNTLDDKQEIEFSLQLRFYKDEKSEQEITEPVIKYFTEDNL